MVDKLIHPLRVWIICAAPVGDEVPECPGRLCGSCTGSYCRRCPQAWGFFAAAADMATACSSQMKDRTTHNAIHFCFFIIMSELPPLSIYL